MEATGILANVAKTAGFGSVSELLVQNPNAKSLSMFKREGSAGQEGEAPVGVPAKRVRRESVPAPAVELLDDSLLGERDTPLPVRLMEDRGQPRAMPDSGAACPGSARASGEWFCLGHGTALGARPNRGARRSTLPSQEACALEIPAPAVPRRGGKAGGSAGSRQQDRLCLKGLKSQGQLLEIIEFAEVGRAGAWRRPGTPPPPPPRLGLPATRPRALAPASLRRCLSPV